MIEPSADNHPSAMPSTSLDRMIRLMSMPYTNFLTVGTTCPDNLTPPTPSARPLPSAPAQPPPVLAALLRNFADSLKHQHGRQWQLRTAGKHFTAAASKQILKFKARTSILHAKSVLAAVRGLTRSIP